uniref:Neutral ceramidase n=1 Tax=Culicoides sonorensis TaxID=179676 RepID=A0A336MNH5_CULSO
MNIFFNLIGILSLLSYGHGYIVGLGRSDCTGPAVEIGFMGYANIKQHGKGIHLRQFARTFIVQDQITNERVVFVSVDAAMMGHSVKQDVVNKLQNKYGNIYRMDNLVISGTHTHSAPGGFLTYLMYDMTVLGFVKDTYMALVNGIYESIERAHNNMRYGRIFISEIDVEDANINRSPSAYENNPKEERDQYLHNTDKKLVQLRFEDLNSNIMGAFNWFAIHPVSMNNTNRLISSDNVGYASILLEKNVNPNDLVGNGSFVGAFASTNLGDVSPNIMGPKCEKTGNSCDVLSSKCPKGEGPCFASGPGQDMFESTKIIGNRLFDAASKLLNDRGGKEIVGPIAAIIQNIDMPTQKGQFNNTILNKIEEYQGCLPAMGYSFAAGTTDGPGLFTFEQGTTTENPMWNLVRDFLAEPTEEDKLCQGAKPILLMVGRSNFPYDWVPRIVPTQVLRLGTVILAVSGRRMRKHLKQVVESEIGKDFDVIVAGLSNLYTSYIATPEEFEIQRYEGASTLFGPHTLTIYLNQYEKLTRSMLRKERIDPGPNQPDLSERQISLNPPVLYDGHPAGRDYGDVIIEPLALYDRGDEVFVKFISGNPRNKVLRGETYFAVEQKQNDGTWKIILTDADWDTKFIWKRTNTILGLSEISFYWKISSEVTRGTYRIKHFGCSVHHMESLVESEKFLIETLEYFIDHEEKLISELKSKIVKFKALHKQENQTTDEYLSNPINEYLLMKRLYSDWTEVNSQISFGAEFVQNNYKYLVDNQLLPSAYDIGGAADAIFRLQDTYSINTENFASGKIDGVEVNATMTARDCFDLGYQAYGGKNYQKASEWLYESYKRTKLEGRELTVNWKDLLDALSNSLFQIGNVEAAYNFAKELLDKYPDNEKAGVDFKKYENLLYPNEENYGSDPQNTEIIDPFDYNEHEFNRYMKVCRGELTKSAKEQSQLKCFYEFHASPYLKIGGVKVEQVNIYPPVVIFHDVLFDSEIELMINVSKSQLHRSEVVGESFGESIVGEYRVSQNTGIHSKEHSFLSKIDKRIEAITGLSTESSEGHQVANYGIGGHYEPHLDFTSKFGDVPLDSWERDGNRIATLVFYLTDVLKGGATAFPYLNVKVSAKKGSALFWHNLYKDGEGNYLTRHAACPVLIGNKWSNNVWLRERGQEFKRPCDLNPDHESDDVWISLLGK